MANTLAHPAYELKVFPPGTTDFSGSPLGAAGEVPAGSSTAPVIVVAPDRNTGTADNPIELSYLYIGNKWKNNIVIPFDLALLLLLLLLYALNFIFNSLALPLLHTA